MNAQNNPNLAYNRDVVVVNVRGIHMRPADQIQKLANTFSSKITLMSKGETVDAKSMLELMTFAAEAGSNIKISVTGIDALQALEAICNLIASGFNEDIVSS